MRRCYDSGWRREYVHTTRELRTPTTGEFRCSVTGGAGGTEEAKRVRKPDRPAHDERAKHCPGRRLESDSFCSLTSRWAWAYKGGMDLEALRLAFDRIAELAIQNHMRSPLTMRVIDTDSRTLVKVELTWDQGGWHGQLEKGDLESRTGISFPWFIVAADSTGRSLKVRVELQGQSQQIN
jgi:hypothetical protein